MALLTSKSLTVTIAGKRICENFDFQLERGQHWGVLGGNGVGKTTLLLTLAGFRQPDQGDISIDGINLMQWRRKALARKLGILFQDSLDTFPALVIETALTGRHPYLPFWGIEDKHDIDIAQQALLDVSMQTMATRQVNTLSGGERRRLAIATLFVQNPLLWLLDEPTNHLDLHHQISLLQLIIERVDAVNGGLFMVLHDINLVTRFCTHAMLIIDHESILCGPVEDIMTLENLQSLYQHPIKELESDGIKYFFPE